MRPMTDLCSVCQQNSTSIMRAANQPEEEKTEVCIHRNYCLTSYYCIQLVKCAEKHLTLATEARSYMKSRVEKSANDIQRVFGSSIPPLGYCLPSCSAGMTILLILHSRFVYHTKNNNHNHDNVQVYYPHNPAGPPTYQEVLYRASLIALQLTHTVNIAFLARCILSGICS